MSVIAKDINALFDLFQRDKDEINEIIETNPASYLARVLQLQNTFKVQEPSGEAIQRVALYAGNMQWFEFLADRMNAPAGEEIVSDHFAVNIPVEEVMDRNPVADEEQPVDANPDADIDPEVEKEEKDQQDILSPAPDEVLEDVTEQIATSGSADENAVNESLENIDQVDEQASGYDDEVTEKKTVDSDEQSPQHGSTGPIDTEEEGIAQPEEFIAEKHPEQNLQQDVRKEDEDLPAMEAETRSEDVQGNERVEVQEDQESPVVFEPLHTIDYFASQGIKLTEADLANDRLGQQVKSFTGWLKSMKKLHPGKLPEQDEVVQQIIQNAAEASNLESDVLTEAMAEVLVKQNKKEKAVEMYEKLSLMNPSKSAYFAAKIESLKTS